MKNYTSHASVWISAVQFTVKISLVASNIHSPHECLTFISLHLCLQFCLCCLVLSLGTALSAAISFVCCSQEPLLISFFCALICSHSVHNLYLCRDNYIIYLYESISPCWEPNLVFLWLVSWLIHSHSVSPLLSDWN